MGKYSDWDRFVKDDLLGSAWIANELAETNRLKRLELRLMQGLLTSKRELEKELEDRA